MVAISHEEIKRNLQRIPKIKPFVNKFNLKGINSPSKIDNWKIFQKNNSVIARNIFYIKEKEILPACTSKHDSTREKQIIL